MTNTEVDRLGTRIAKTPVGIEAQDLASLQEYRQSFQKPIAEVFAFVSKECAKIDRQSIVTYRIKRIDTIINKLKRFAQNSNGQMKLSRMWDIAGCRCILNTTDESKIYKLLDKIKAQYGQNCKINDYLDTPRESGYRSVHIYVKDSLYGKPVEIQLRNRLHHNWSTLVEIIDVLKGTKVKEGKEDGDLTEFLKLYSEVKNLPTEEFDRLVFLVRKNRIFESMSNTLTKNYLSVKKQWLTQSNKGSYFVIEANRVGSVIESYPSFAEAEEEYYYKYVNHKASNIVLTHIVNPNFDQINMAYSNYVLAMHSFFDDYRRYVSQRLVSTVENREYLRFTKYFWIYMSNTRFHLHNLRLEIKKIQECEKNGEIKLNHIGKWRKDVKERIRNWTHETRYFFERLLQVAKDKFFYRLLIKSKMRTIIRMYNQEQED